MIFLGLAFVSFISFFFSLIFSTAFFQNKRWNNIYISLSLLLISLNLFSLFIGKLFIWYDWMILLFIYSFTLIAPSMFGIVWESLPTIFKKNRKPSYSIIYALIYAVLSITYLINVLYLMGDKVLITAQGVELQWMKTHLMMYSWLTGIFSILFILGCFFLWIRKQGNAWILLGLGGLLYFFAERMASQSYVNLFIYLFIHFVLVILLYQGSRRIGEETTPYLQPKNKGR